MFGHSALRIDIADFPDPQRDTSLSATAGTRTEAVLAGGCFWCTEAVYRELDGVLDVMPGYSGGTRQDADYHTVCSGMTDHAETIRVGYDPARITFGRLLKVFFSVAHDPTQVDRQGNDVGRQYRSVIFYVDDEQRDVAQAYIAQLDAASVYAAPVATVLKPLAAFYEAENHHHDYAARHPEQPYIACVAQPKVDKLRHYFPDALRGR
ncbi:MAG: peptide-methionine (S)-S-oxide reductase [Nevskiaceae bacterium]|nr:MAG: peptide-methionine (S)-S-oxide reductase [Nevskiaceae bacterium]TBR71988.1 MAG: peptide-methionine (S)-S-oxide reductase [Nevskiaceae bacterium]